MQVTGEDHTVKIFSIEFLRPAVLFCAMISIFAFSKHQQIYSRLWNEPLDVIIYPINADSTLATHNYIKSLNTESFAEIDRWIASEAARHGLAQAQPLRTVLGRPVKSIPPLFPEEPAVFNVVWWGLKMRYWVFRNTPDNESNLSRIRVFISYQNGDDNLPHSVGLQKGLIGVVHAYSRPEQTAQNNIVVAHEILHTVGASDKYSRTGAPLFPDGYYNPDRVPLHPQRYAEIMAGQIPLSTYNSYMAESLKSTRINAMTAREIAWIK